MNAIARNEVTRRRLSLTLTILGAALALIGGALLYVRENVLDADALSGRAQDALADERVRLALAQPITEAIIDGGPAKLVNARPLIESVVTGALGTAPAKAAFGEAVKALDAKLFDRDPDALLLNIADLASVTASAVEAVSPDVAEGIPERFKGLRLEVTQSIGSIRTVRLADEIRIGGLLLPPLALLSLLGSVALARDRRRALVRAGVAVATAAIVGVVSLAVGRSLLLSLFDDQLIRDGVDAIWEALLDDLRGGFLLAAVIAIVLAAAARFTVGQDFDPLAPFVRAGGLLRRRPERALPAALRGLGLIAIGFAFILEPELSLEAVAVVAGAWVLYVGVSEILAIVGPVVEPSPGEQGGRSFRVGRAAGLGAAATVAVALVLVLSGDDELPSRPPGPPAACNGYAELCSKRIDELAFAGTHNSMSAAEEPGWFLPNQRYGIQQQLDDGVRALLIDTHYGIRRGDGRGIAQVITDLQKEQKTRQEVVAELGEPTVAKAENLVGNLAFDGTEGSPEPYLCHVLCELGATKLDDALAGIDGWLAGHPDELLILFIEDVVSPAETAAAFERSGLLRYAYVPERGVPSPPLGELIEGDRRLLVMAENDSGGGKYPWYQQGFDLVQETPYTFRSIPEIESPESCRPNRGAPGNPLFQINSWIEKIPRDPDLAARIDSLEALLARAALCERIRGLAPNLLAVDYYDRGDVLGVTNVLNGLAADAPAEVRVLP